jgi:hypothetical protein
MRNYSFIFYLFWEQHVTVGVVGGSNLAKITEQLGKTGDEHRRSIIALMMNSATLEVIGLSFFVIMSSLKTARLHTKMAT